jgi:ribosome recycling factor
MIEDILLETEMHMEDTIEATRRHFGQIRTGRASPALVEHILVDYYGTLTPLQQLATISTPDPRLIVIAPYDKTQMHAYEKALALSDLGLTPNSDGNVIRIVIPPLTEERRKELVKVVSKMAEESREAIRGHRRHANNRLRALEREKVISEDDFHRAQEQVQELHDEYIQRLNELLRAKEQEIMEV